MDYTPWIPTDQDRQESPNPWAETNGCESFAMVHCIEIQERKLTGTEVDYSEQIVCVGSGTNPASGNSVGNVFNWIDNNGLVLTSVSPEPTNFTVSQFYVPQDPKVVATGQLWKNKWSIFRTPITPVSAISSLSKAPILITIDLNPDGDATGYHQFHEVVLINDHEYFDSYGQLIKPMTFTTGQPHKIYYADLILLTPKTMSNSIFVHKTGTKEYGFYDPDLSEDSIKNSALNRGINILNPDGTINYSLAKETTGLNN